MSSTSSSAQAGMLLGRRYELVEPIASGGMAQVWRGRDVSLVRPVAIKILHPHLALDQAFVSRFRREAIAAAKLSHPSIVAVYDTLSEQGVEAIVMELIDGRTLRSVLDEVALLPPSDVVDVGIQISDALDTAHRAGIVHRDIKPANIMVGTDRRIMVTDFGIAKANKDDDLTHTGTLLGTAKYLAPEQVTGEPVDPRADIYALGVVLFEAATGQAPFLADTDAATALARLQGEVPRCRQRRPEIPVGLDEVIARTMARRPEERYDRALSLRAALAGVDLTNVQPVLADLPPPAAGPAWGNPGRGATADVPPPAPPPFGATPTRTSTPTPAPAALGGSGTAVLPQPSLPGAGAPNRRAQKSARKAARTQAKAARKAAKDQRSTRTLAALLIVGGLVVAGALLASLGAVGGGGDGGGSAGDGSPLALVGAEPFDPQGDGTELARLAANAIDGDESTAWRTESYHRPALGGLKDGVGLIVDLDGEHATEGIEVVSGSDGWRMEVYVAGGFDGAPQGEPAAVLEGGQRAQASLGGAAGSKVLLWITETGLTEVPERGETRRFVLNEVVVR
jgi:serine/threonine protein kinase